MELSINHIGLDGKKHRTHSVNTRARRAREPIANMNSEYKSRHFPKTSIGNRLEIVVHGLEIHATHTLQRVANEHAKVCALVEVI